MVPFFAKMFLPSNTGGGDLLIGKNCVTAKKRPSTNLPNKSFLILYNLITKKALHATNRVIDKKREIDDKINWQQVFFCKKKKKERAVHFERR